MYSELVEIIVQCTPGLDDCDNSATCMEFPDGHRCVCNSGFTGDGVTCTGTHTYSTLHVLISIL